LLNWEWVKQSRSGFCRNLRAANWTHRSLSIHWKSWNHIAQQQLSLVSPMPAGLLDTLTKEQLLDLLAYLELAADPVRLPPRGQNGQLRQ
jgi:hypothetical protein